MEQKKVRGFGFRGWMLILYQAIAYITFQCFTQYPLNILAPFYGGSQKVANIYSICAVVGILVQIVLAGVVARMKKIKLFGAILGAVTLLLALGVMLLPAGGAWDACYAVINVVSVLYATFALGILVGQWFPTRKGIVMGIATLAFPIDATTQVTLTTDDMPLTQAGRTGSFTFRSTQVDAGAHQVTELSGFFDDFGPIFVDATIDNRYQVRLTSAPTLFGYTATAVSTEKGEHPSLTSTSVAYQLTLNHNTGKATLIIDPFQLEDKGEVTRMLQIPDIAFSINANGYHLTKDIVEPRTEQGRIPALTITNLDIDVSQNGRYIQGGFYCDGHYMSLLGRMVPSTDILVN